MPRYRIYRYDTWGNEEDGFEVNDTYRTANVYDIEADWTNERIIAAIEGEGITLEWPDEDICYINETATGKPLGELRRENN